MSKVKYGLIGFGGIAENRVAKEGFACDKARFAPLRKAELPQANLPDKLHLSFLFTPPFPPA